MFRRNLILPLLVLSTALVPTAAFADPEPYTVFRGGVYNGGIVTIEGGIGIRQDLDGFFVGAEGTVATQQPSGSAELWLAGLAGISLNEQIALYGIGSVGVIGNTGVYGGGVGVEFDVADYYIFGEVFGRAAIGHTPSEYSFRIGFRRFWEDYGDEGGSVDDGPEFGDFNDRLDVCDALGLTGLTISSDSTALEISGEVRYEFQWGDYVGASTAVHNHNTPDSTHFVKAVDYGMVFPTCNNWYVAAEISAGAELPSLTSDFFVNARAGWRDYVGSHPVTIYGTGGVGFLGGTPSWRAGAGIDVQVADQWSVFAEGVVRQPFNGAWAADYGARVGFHYFPGAPH